jgi:hypothetical protein
MGLGAVHQVCRRYLLGSGRWLGIVGFWAVDRAGVVTVLVLLILFGGASLLSAFELCLSFCFGKISIYEDTCLDEWFAGFS